MFRGSLIKAMGSNAHPLMHNHTEEGLRFGYPLVQYKSVEGRACVVAIDEVGEYILRYFKTNETIPLLMRKNEYKCRVDRPLSSHIIILFEITSLSQVRMWQNLMG